MFSETLSIQPERSSRYLAWSLWGVATLLMMVSARQVEMALATSVSSSGLSTWLTAGAIVVGLFWCQLATVYFALRKESTFYSVLYSALTLLMSGLFNVWAFTKEVDFGTYDWGVSCAVGLMVPFFAFLANQVAAQLYLVSTGYLNGTLSQEPAFESELLERAGESQVGRVNPGSIISQTDVMDLPIIGHAHSVKEQEQSMVHDLITDVEDAHSNDSETSAEVLEAVDQNNVVSTLEIGDAELLVRSELNDRELVSQAIVETVLVESEPIKMVQDNVRTEEAPLVVEAHSQFEEASSPIEADVIPVNKEPVEEIALPSGPSVNVFVKERQVTVRVERQTISNSRRKKLHEKLRRLAAVNWDKAEKVEARRDGKVFWTLVGWISPPDIKGKKSKKKKHAAMARHVEAVSDQLEALIEQYRKT